MKKVLYIIVVFIGFIGSAQNDELFNNATEAYNKGEYDKAIELYTQILDNGQHSASVYYNLGNAYYKLNHIAPSIYNYEKALLLAPNDPEIKHNLSFAQNMTLDAIEVMPKTGLGRIYKSVTGLFTFDQWSYIAVISLLLFVLLYIAFYYFRYSLYKRIAFISSIVALFIMATSLVFAFVQYNDFMADQPAIVFDSEVQIKAEPNMGSQAIFLLHEGTKVNVLDELNEWKKIRIADGKSGWLTSKSIKLLKNF